MSEKLIKFNLPKQQQSLIKVIGVGGGGSNAVNHMFQQGIEGVDFIVCNTDSQDLNSSPVPKKIQLGLSLTEGLGAGGDPEVGKNAALENIEQIKEALESNTKMVFITSGLGGGTGTGGAPIIAAVAKELGILTVGIVTIPFFREGPRRKQQAEQGLQDMRKYVDAVIVICNDKLREMYGNLSITNAFQQADNILAIAAKGIAEIITLHGKINVDFNDVKTVMHDSGVAIIGSAAIEGKDRALKAVQQALASPLLNDNNIKDARYVLLNITSGKQEVLLDEISEITDYIQEEAGSSANVYMGLGTDLSLENKISVTVIASGFKTNPDLGFAYDKQPEKIMRTLDLNLCDEKKTAGFPSTAPQKEAEDQEKNKNTALSEPEKKHEEQPRPQPAKKAGNHEEQQGSLEFILNPKPGKQILHKGNTKSDEQKPTPLQNPLLSGKHKTQPPVQDDDPHGYKKRIERLKQLSYRLKTPSGVSDIENEPAFIRRNIKLEELPHSSDPNISRYTLSQPDDEEGKTEIKPNNPYLHDNVD